MSAICARFSPGICEKRSIDLRKRTFSTVESIYPDSYHLTRSAQTPPLLQSRNDGVAGAFHGTARLLGNSFQLGGQQRRPVAYHRRFVAQCGPDHLLQLVERWAESSQAYQ